MTTKRERITVTTEREAEFIELCNAFVTYANHIFEGIDKGLGRKTARLVFVSG